MSRTQRLDALVVLALAVLAPGAARAQASASAPPTSSWQFALTVYGYLPTISGNTAFPTGGGTPIEVGVDQILDKLKFTFMGSADVHNGRWGLLTDVIYLDLGDTKTQSRDLAIGGVTLPAGATAQVDLDLKAWVWTLAGQYRLVSDPALTFDLLGGARMLDVQQRLRWNITGSLGTIDTALRSGGSEVQQTSWDGIVGFKGRYLFGADREWSMPFYADVGAGDSNRTWQAGVGVGYAFKWGELLGMWRALDYQMKSGQAIQNLRFSGPLIGATFRW